MYIVEKINFYSNLKFTDFDSVRFGNHFEIMKKRSGQFFAEKFGN